jgi:hypothetical protein
MLHTLVGSDNKDQTKPVHTISPAGRKPVRRRTGRSESALKAS